eukprot:811527-Alexandrium_andersonii.AAC.1
MVANTEAQHVKVDEQLAELGTRRMELIVKRKHYAEQLVFHKKRLDQMVHRAAAPATQSPNPSAPTNGQGGGGGGAAG